MYPNAEITLSRTNMPDTDTAVCSSIPNRCFGLTQMLLDVTRWQRRQLPLKYFAATYSSHVPKRQGTHGLLLCIVQYACIAQI